jgi:hypothetical protein
MLFKFFFITRNCVFVTYKLRSLNLVGTLRKRISIFVTEEIFRGLNDHND